MWNLGDDAVATKEISTRLVPSCELINNKSITYTRGVLITCRTGFKNEHAIGSCPRVSTSSQLGGVCIVSLGYAQSRVNYKYTETIFTLRTGEAAAQCIVIAPVCLFVCLWWVCYHDNSKLRASILTKLGL